LKYVGFYLSNDKLVRGFNGLMLGGLIYVGIYHFVNGVFKYNKKFSPGWKKLGFGLVNGLSLIGWIVIYNFKVGSGSSSNDFYGRTFTKYLTWGYV